MAEERGTRLIAVCWSLVAASAVMLFLRVYCKLWRRRGLWWDDHFLIISWFSLVIAVALNTYIVSLGFGSHIWTISDENLKKINLDTIIVAAFGIISTTTGKTSFAITLYRITETKWMKWFLIFVIITVNLFLNFVWIFGLAKCTPFARVYDKSVPGTCWNLQRLAKFQLFAAYYSAILDFVLAFLPWQVLMGLNMKLREKIGVAVAMSLGAVAGATGIVKAVLVVSMTDPDVTYQRVDLTIWTLAEPAVTIMAICIPVLRSLYREIKTSSQRSNTYRNKSRLTSNEPHTGTHGSSADARKSSRVLGFSAKYGRDHVNVMSMSDFRESQEALKDVESNSSEHDVSNGGIMKTEEYRVRMERVSSEDRGFSTTTTPPTDVEMVPMGRGHHHAR